MKSSLFADTIHNNACHIWVKTKKAAHLEQPFLLTKYFYSITSFFSTYLCAVLSLIEYIPDSNSEVIS